jgi:hypothetical protein
MPEWLRKRMSRDLKAAAKTVAWHGGDEISLAAASQCRRRFGAIINGLYGLDPLGFFAARLALGIQPQDDRGFLDCLADYEDALDSNPDLSFQHLVLAGSSGCFFFPVKNREVLYPEGKPFVVGSTLELNQEIRSLYENLESGLCTASALEDVAREELTKICEGLRDVVRESITHSLPLVLYWDFNSWDGKQPFNDYSASPLGFMEFAGSSVNECEGYLRVSFRSGATYSIPSEYVASWFEGSDYDQRLKQSGQSLIVRSRVISRGTETRIFWGNGTHRDIPWDTVLMACEPMYENFGGFTEQSRRTTERWLAKMGSFRT